MKSLFMLFLFAIASVSAFAQSQPDSYTLTLAFRPSFTSGSKLVIQTNSDSSFLNIQISKNTYTKREAIENRGSIPTNKLTTLTNFLKTYKFRIKNNIDTVARKSHDSTWIYNIRMGIDGITVDGSFSQNGFMHKFAFWSPSKGTENAMLMIIVFELMDRAFSNKETVSYIKELKEYFQ